MAAEQLGGAAHRVKVTLDWKINGRSVDNADALRMVVGEPKRRLTEATRKIKAHVKSHVGPKAAFKFASKDELQMAQISASMGREAFEDAVDNIPDLRYTMGPKDQNHEVEVSFGDVTAGGRRRGKTRRNRKARSTRRR